MIRRSFYALFAAMLLCLAADQSHAQGRFGFGFVFGQPTGVAWKYRISSMNALDGAIGFSPFDRFRFDIDYLWQSHPFEDEHLALHYGLGGAVGVGHAEFVIIRGDGYVADREEAGFGLRTVVGLTYTIPRSPLDVFAEVAPVFVVTPNGGIDVDAGLGVRIYP